MARGGKRKPTGASNGRSKQERQWISTRRLAELWDVEEQTISNARCTGRGAFATLPFYRLGKNLVRYDWVEAQEWLAARRVERGDW
jgi:hypothetical protein